MKKTTTSKERVSHIKTKKKAQKALHKAAPGSRFTKNEIITGSLVGLFLVGFAVFATALSGYANILVILGRDEVKIASKSAQPAASLTGEGLQTAVANWRYSTGDSTFQPMPQNHYVVVDVKLKHGLDKPAWFAPVVQSYIKDDQNNKYTMSPLEDLNALPAQEYGVDQEASGELSYQVPKNAKNLEWCVEMSANDPTRQKCIPL